MPVDNRLITMTIEEAVCRIGYEAVEEILKHDPGATEIKFVFAAIPHAAVQPGSAMFGDMLNEDTPTATVCERSGHTWIGSYYRHHLPDGAVKRCIECGLVVDAKLGL